MIMLNTANVIVYVLILLLTSVCSFCVYCDTKLVATGTASDSNKSALDAPACGYKTGTLGIGCSVLFGWRVNAEVCPHFGMGQVDHCFQCEAAQVLKLQVSARVNRPELAQKIHFSGEKRVRLVLQWPNPFELVQVVQFGSEDSFDFEDSQTQQLIRQIQSVRTRPLRIFFRLWFGNRQIFVNKPQQEPFFDFERVLIDVFDFDVLRQRRTFLGLKTLELAGKVVHVRLTEVEFVLGNEGSLELLAQLQNLVQKAFVVILEANRLDLQIRVYLQIAHFQKILARFGQHRLPEKHFIHFHKPIRLILTNSLLSLDSSHRGHV